MSTFRRISFLVMVFVLVVAAAGVTVAAQESEPVQDSAPKMDDPLRDMKGYADEWGIDLDEAARRLELQDVAGELEADLYKQERDTFAGLWIEHTPEFRIVVQFTRDGEKTIRQYVEATLLADVVEVQTAGVTLAELEAAQIEALQAIRSMDIAVDAGINVQKNRVELYTIEATLLNGALQEAKIQLSDSVEIIEVDELAVDEAYIYGGLPLSTCTSGWPVQSGSTKGISTAAHCGNSQKHDGKSLNFESEKYETYYDVQWHTPKWYYFYTVKPWFRSKTGYYRVVTGTKSRSSQSVGNYVCKQGMTTDYTCGYITDKYYAPSYVPDVKSTFIRMHRDGVDLSSGGDSGGPWFNGNTAYGSHSGGIGDDSIYMAINYISGIGVSVYTD